MLLADSKKAREIDRKTIEDYKIPSSLLMENAGMRVADEALLADGENYVVLAGKGNNGGDGSVAARHIFCNGKKVTLVMLADPDELKGDARAMYDAAKSTGVDIEIGFTKKAKEILEESHVIIDAILGIGCTGAPSGVYKDVIDFVNNLDKLVIAVDVPSGVNADNGAVLENAVKCRKTVTFGIGRLGLMLYPAKEYAGEICVRSISFVPSAIEETNIMTKTLEYKPLPPLSEDCHKSSVGKVLVVAGSEGMTGAAYLSSTSALKSGSGVVTLCIPRTFNHIMEQKLTEVMTIPVADNGKTMVEDAAEEIIKQSEKYDSLVIGCGLGWNEDTKKLVNKVVANAKCNIVIDADAINCIDKEIIKGRKNVVLTPHIGEMSRLAGMTADEIKADLVKTASDFSKNYGVAIVLKCATTVVAFPDGEVYINTIGNSGMATAGSGDVLAGVIGSILAQVDCFKTAILNGVWIHSAAGDNAAERLGKKFMSATDIADSLRYVLNQEGM